MEGLIFIKGVILSLSQSHRERRSRRTCGCRCFWLLQLFLGKPYRQLPYSLIQKRPAPPRNHNRRHPEKQNRSSRIQQHIIKTTSPPHQKSLMHLIHASHAKRAQNSQCRSRKRQPAPRPLPRSSQTDRPPSTKQQPQRTVPAKVAQLPQHHVCHLHWSRIRLPPQRMKDIEQPPSSVCATHRTRRLKTDDREPEQHRKPRHHQRRSFTIVCRSLQIIHENKCP